MMKCQRCGKDMTMFTNSAYTDELICYECIKVEQSHPTYKHVKRLEHEAVKRGDMNFNYGLPKDIKRKYPKYAKEFEIICK